MLSKEVQVSDLEMTPDRLWYDSDIISTSWQEVIRPGVLETLHLCKCLDKYMKLKTYKFREALKEYRPMLASKDNVQSEYSWYSSYFSLSTYFYSFIFDHLLPSCMLIVNWKKSSGCCNFIFLSVYLQNLFQFLFSSILNCLNMEKIVHYCIYYLKTEKKKCKLFVFLCITSGGMHY